MQVSLNIILDAIKHYGFEQYGEIPEDIAFNRILLLPHTGIEFRAGTLYVCRLSDVMKASEGAPQAYCICLCDLPESDRDNLSLPCAGTVVVSEEMPFEQFAKEIHDAFVTVSQWYESMLHALITKKSIQDILIMSEPVIGNFISISDSTLALIAYTKNIQTDDPVSLYLIENGCHSIETVRNFKKFKRYDSWKSTDEIIVNTKNDISKYTIISKVFNFNSTYFMHVVMSCNYRELSKGLLDLFELLSRVLGYYITKEWEEKTLSNTVYSSLFNDLMLGVTNNKVEERAGLIGIMPEDEYIIMLLTEGNRGDSTFPGHMAQEISNLASFAKPINYNMRLVIFLHHPDIEQKINDDKLYEKLNEYFAENNVYCGVSDTFNNLLEVSEAYKQADLVLSEVVMYNSRGSTNFKEMSGLSNTATFSTFFAKCMLDKNEKTESLWRYSKFGKMLFSLHEYDQVRQTNCLEILYSYLINERRATETANNLHMHRNTVIYHISRIEKVLGIDLNDRLTRLNLIVSFLMLERLGFSAIGGKGYIEEKLPDEENAFGLPH